jgi:mono/diheme cytochrome c family protein
MKKFKIFFLLLLVFSFSIVSSNIWANGKEGHKKLKKVKMKEHWAAPVKERERINPVSKTLKSIQNGEKLFLNNCSGCHGLAARGDGPDAEFLEPKPTNLRAMAGHHSDGDQAWKITNGKDPMPAWGDMFSENQIWDIVNFIQSLKRNH